MRGPRAVDDPGRTTRGRRAPLAALAGLLVAAAACRLGGPDDVAFAPAEAGAAPVAEAGGGDAEPSAPDAGPLADAGPTPDGGAVDAHDAAADVDPITDGACVPPQPSAVCDPVCNTGCNAAARCDVADAVRTGRCVGIWIGKEGEFCTSTSLTNTCAPRLTCQGNKCLRLCYRKGDCENGACCNVAIDVGRAPAGFKGCGPC